jgi:PTS system N-acetylgalactosamine-specific IIA component
MKRIIVIGHGGYAEGIRQNLEMIAGPRENMYFLDLTKDIDLAALEQRVKNLLDGFPEDEVLFACDLLGASPFQVAAMRCVENPGRYYAVAALNTMALLDTSMNAENEMTIEELADFAVETTKAAVARFPEKENGI